VLPRAPLTPDHPLQITDTTNNRRGLIKVCFVLLGILASSNVVLDSNGMWFAVWWIVLFQFLVYDFLALMLNTCVKIERQ
jgi:hypothetical protein